ncbi:M14 family zinc carboxypeptidase [Seonamhaeicola marinus]|uniref:Peptidase M14 n=1 Tax=Seonamhaeicola marinus TaxID=1912246 RepID=A0A5D0HR36_9FLAO|nr:M14 family zinc carboxypeptidase [Seonamhaeicola marinus]TYA71852.1 peptidase M14 [Seonamhaeicola marinus]
MEIEQLKSLYLKSKENALNGRYITNNNIKPLLDNLTSKFEVDVIGKSVLNKPIYGVKVGTGEKRILMWSQMHGNESTTTKALFDLFNALSTENDLDYVLEACTLYFIPILNPDGAEAYTRINANEIDLNRDAQNRSQPESKVLRAIYESFKPHYCYNLHGQRTIFSAGKANKSAIVSFLSPAQDESCTITENRKVSMEIIAKMNEMLQNIIPEQVGVYDDAFNINCVGDTFQTENVPTILFEAGHYPNDYDREQTRALIFMSYLTSLDYISQNNVDGKKFKGYALIPENEKQFFDIIIRNVSGYGEDVLDIAIQFKEVLTEGSLNFVPIVEKIEKLNGFYGHKELDANRGKVLDVNGVKLSEGNENVIVILNNEEIALNLK